MIGQIAPHRQFPAVERGVAPAMDALVGDDLERDEISAGTGDDDLGIDDLGHWDGPVQMISSVVFWRFSLSGPVMISNRPGSTTSSMRSEEHPSELQSLM